MKGGAILFTLLPAVAGAPCRQRVNESNCNVLMKALVADPASAETVQSASCFNFCAGQLISTAPFFLGTTRCNGRLGSLPYVAGCTMDDLEHEMVTSTSIPGAVFTATSNGSNGSNGNSFSPNTPVASSPGSTGGSSSSPPVVTFPNTGTQQVPVQEAPVVDVTFSEPPPVVVTFPWQNSNGGFDVRPQPAANSDGTPFTPPVVTFDSEFGPADSTPTNEGSVPVTGGGDDTPTEMDSPPMEDSPIPGSDLSVSVPGGQPSPSPDVVDFPEESVPVDSETTMDGDDEESAGSDNPIADVPLNIVPPLVTDENLSTDSNVTIVDGPLTAVPSLDSNDGISTASNVTVVDGPLDEAPSETSSNDMSASATQEESKEDSIDGARDEDDMEESSSRLRVATSIVTSAFATTMALSFL